MKRARTMASWTDGAGRGRVTRGLGEAGTDIAYGAMVGSRAVVNVARGRRAAPDYVTFVVDGAYPELPPALKAWQRRLFPHRPTLQELRDQTLAVAGDPRVRGVVFHLRPLDMPMARLESLREILVGLRSAGKHVVAWASRYTTATYYVANAADEIVLQPGGEIGPLGLEATYAFLADSLDRVGLRFDSVAISPYKSAADTLSRSEMSDEVREMANWLLDASYAEFVGAVAAGRGMDLVAARRLIDEAPYTDRQAFTSGAVDAVCAEEDLPERLGAGGATQVRPGAGGATQARQGAGGATQARPGEGGATQALLTSYPKARKTLLLAPPHRPGRCIGVLRIEGTIVDGESSRPPAEPPFSLPLLGEPRAGDLTIVRQARALAEDDRVAAVVLFVSSPGGSATASEAMASALGRLAERKPLVVSMGSVAASGGYYVATPGRWIVAQPDTLTGSIGVLFGKLVSADLLDRILVHREHLYRGQHIGMYGGEAPFDEDQRQRVSASIHRIYEVFVERVAASRSMSAEAVDAVGGGRVWTGRQALEHGLVDQMGGLVAAVERARHEADLSPRAPLRETFPPKQPIAPLTDPTAFLRYAADTARLLERASALLLCPMDWRVETS